MKSLGRLNLTLVVCLPWFVILGTLYWVYPRQPRNACSMSPH